MLLYGMVFLPKLLGAVYKSYVMPANLYEHIALCLRVSRMRVL